MEKSFKETPMYTKEQVFECMKWARGSSSDSELEWCFLKGTNQPTEHMEVTVKTGPMSEQDLLGEYEKLLDTLTN